MIKLTLIKNHTREYNFSEIEEYREKLNESEKKFDGLTLHNSLKKAYELKLLTSKQFEYLKAAKNSYRNPFSHAQVAKINEKETDFGGFMFIINDVRKSLVSGKKIELPNRIKIPKFSPAISQMLQENNAKGIALNYFKSVFIILTEIENQVFNKQK